MLAMSLKIGTLFILNTTVLSSFIPCDSVAYYENKNHNNNNLPRSTHSRQFHSRNLVTSTSLGNKGNERIIPSLKIVESNDIHKSLEKIDINASEKNRRDEFPTSSSLSINKSYHLLWSPNVARKTIAITSVLISLRIISSFYFNRATTMSRLHSPAVSWSCHASNPLETMALATISSACCGVQLLINAVFSGGCTGFNKYLGPMRPIFLAIMMYSGVVSFPRAAARAVLFPNAVSRPTTTIAAMSLSQWTIRLFWSWSIALLPEIVHLGNKFRLRQRRLRQQRLEENNDTRKELNSYVLSLSIPSMGCVACIQKVTSSLYQVSDEVIEANSWLDDDTPGGKAKVLVKSNSLKSVEDIANRVQSAVRDAGFKDCDVVSITSNASNN